MKRTSPREARVRASHARGYPLIDPAHWYPASVIADHLTERRRGGPSGEREIPEAAFEFRGGAPRTDAWDPSRRSDRRPRN